MHPIVTLLTQADEIPILISILGIKLPRKDMMHMMCSCHLAVSLAELTGVIVSPQYAVSFIVPSLLF